MARNKLTTTMLIAGLTVAGGGTLAPSCAQKDKVQANFGFYTDSTIYVQRSKKYEIDNSLGWESWLPQDAALSVSCGATDNESVQYSQYYEYGDTHLSYSWDDLAAGCGAGNCVVSDEEWCATVCEPWLTLQPAPYPYSSCTPRRASRVEQDHWIGCQTWFPPTHEMGTCAEDCNDASDDGFCWVLFVSAAGQVNTSAISGDAAADAPDSDLLDAQAYEHFYGEDQP